MSPRLLALVLIAAGLLLAPGSAAATDTDGPDCGRLIQDYGDAPEGVPLPWGPIAHFPTCIAPGAPGTQEAACPALSTVPGATGFMQHVQDGTANYWIGCFGTEGAFSGIDSEPDGKFAAAAAQPSACNPAVVTDCAALGAGGDECPGDGSDAGVTPLFSYALLCGIANTLQFTTANCGADRTAYLNVLLDLNSDGDWNDVVPCVDVAPACPCAQAPPCFPEWAVKNVAIQVPHGCASQQTPAFQVPFTAFPVWTRISLTDEPVDDDYPWAGSANRLGAAYLGGETEDYAFGSSTPDPAQRSTWGMIRIRYR